MCDQCMLDIIETERHRAYESSPEIDAEENNIETKGGKDV